MTLHIPRFKFEAGQDIQRYMPDILEARARKIRFRNAVPAVLTFIICCLIVGAVILLRELAG